MAAHRELNHDPSDPFVRPTGRRPDSYCQWVVVACIAGSRIIQARKVSGQSPRDSQFVPYGNTEQRRFESSGLRSMAKGR